MVVLKIMMVIKIEINIIGMDNFDISNNDNCYFHQYPHYHYNRYFLLLFLLLLLLVSLGLL